MHLHCSGEWMALFLYILSLKIKQWKSFINLSPDYEVSFLGVSEAQIWLGASNGKIPRKALQIDIGFGRRVYYCRVKILVKYFCSSLHYIVLITFCSFSYSGVCSNRVLSIYDVIVNQKKFQWKRKPHILWVGLVPFITLFQYFTLLR